MLIFFIKLFTLKCMGGGILLKEWSYQFNQLLTQKSGTELFCILYSLECYPSKSDMNIAVQITRFINMTHVWKWSVHLLLWSSNSNWQIVYFILQIKIISLLWFKRSMEKFLACAISYKPCYMRNLWSYWMDFVKHILMTNSKDPSSFLSPSEQKYKDKSIK